MTMRTRLETGSKATTSTRQTNTLHQILRSQLLETPWAELESTVVSATEANALLEIDETSELFSNGVQTVGLIEQPPAVPADNISSMYHPSARSIPRTVKDIRDFAAAHEDKADYRTEVRLIVQQIIRSETERTIANDIIDSLDERDYFAGNLSAIAARNELPVEGVESILAQIQRILHNGIAARNDVEAICLLLENEEDKELARAILRQNLQDVRTGRFTKIAKEHGITSDRVSKLLAAIAELDIRAPATAAEKAVPYIYPDIVVHNDNGSLTFQISGGSRPPLRLSSYAKLLETGSLTEADRAYIEEHVREASSFIAALNARSTLLESFAHLLESEEHDFLAGTVTKPTPLSMDETAERLGVSLSTMSRLCKGKYIQTDCGSYPFGIFFLKSFSTVETLHGQQKLQSDDIARMVVNAIRNENPEFLLSDRQIADEITRSSGIKLARRTVAKYRTEANIPNSSYRRRMPNQNQ